MIKFVIELRKTSDFLLKHHKSVVTGKLTQFFFAIGVTITAKKKKPNVYDFHDEKDQTNLFVP
jgi:hypothetical protein